jgi:hypothetical protein
MAWTSPRTWAVSEFVTAALMNTHVRDNLLFLKSNPEIGRATLATGVNTFNVETTALTLSSLAIPADVGKVYVECWGQQWNHTTLGTTGYAAVHLKEATAGLLLRAGNTGDIQQRWLGGEVAHAHAPMYLRTDDFAWAGTTRTITLSIVAVACTGWIHARTDSPVVLRVMRSY